MNVFVLCSGRCGSTTFAKACQHIDNYTSAHESLAGRPATDRFGPHGYPDRHIEADTQMPWFLGPLHDRYGDDVFYVHLERNRDDTAQSLAGFAGRGGFACNYAATLFLSNTPPREHLEESSLTMFYDYVDTITSNIRWFLGHHPNNRQVHIQIENPKSGFIELWERIGARGNVGLAVRELNVRYNSGVGG